MMVRQRDEMISLLLAWMKEMEERITDNVMDAVVGILEKRLDQGMLKMVLNISGICHHV